MLTLPRNFSKHLPSPKYPFTTPRVHISAFRLCLLFTSSNQIYSPKCLFAPSEQHIYINRSANIQMCCVLRLCASSSLHLRLAINPENLRAWNLWSTHRELAFFGAKYLWIIMYHHTYTHTQRGGCAHFYWVLSVEIPHNIVKHYRIKWGFVWGEIWIYLWWNRE